MFDPAQVPRIDTQILRRVFCAHIARRSVPVLFRGRNLNAATSEPSIQKRAAFEAFSQETVELEMMLALPAGSEAPQPNTAEYVRVYDYDDRSVFKDYRIVSVRKQLAADCYFLQLAAKKATR